MATSQAHIADKLADKFTTHAVNLLRFEAYLRRRAVSQLRRLEADLIKQVAEYDPFGPSRTAYQQARLQALLRQTQATIATAYRKMAADTQRELAELARFDAERARRIVNSAVGAEVMTVGVGETMLRQIVSDTLIQGAPTRVWWDRQSDTLRKKFADQMRQGMLRGEGVDPLARRIRGTKARGYTDGIMQASRAQAEALVRTAVNGVANGARQETFRANADVAKGVQALATLDGRTTEICIARSGSAWDWDGNPLPESPRQEPFPGYPPWHWNCRTVMTVVLRSLAEMAQAVGLRKRAALRALPRTTQASIDGQVAANLNYEAWLKTKSPVFQRQVLGQAKWDLWQEGQIGLADLIDQSGRPLPLERLRRAA